MRGPRAAAAPELHHIEADFDRAWLEGRVTLKVASGPMAMAVLFLGFPRVLARQALRPGRWFQAAVGKSPLLGLVTDVGSVKGAVAEAIDETATLTRKFARRQVSWFGRNPNITWFDSPVEATDVLGYLPPLAE